MFKTLLNKAKLFFDEVGLFEESIEDFKTEI